MRDFFLATILLTLLTGCGAKPDAAAYTEIIDAGAYPSVAYDDGMYYMIMQTDTINQILLYASPDPARLAESAPRQILSRATSGMSNFYSPEIHRIGDAWYIYFEGDNGENTDNHQIYVLENRSKNPMKGDWTLHGPVITNGDDWNFGIHPTTFVAGGRQYLLWSGWPKRRTESETQCIYIAEMANPWTLKSPRVMISSPQYEWERQWINPDGHRSAYPIFVNENPEVIISPDGKTISVAYSASGIWTFYNSLGLLTAKAGSDLLNPHSWTKSEEPLFVPEEDSGYFGSSNICVVPAPEGGDSRLIFYQIKRVGDDGLQESSIRCQPITFTPDGIPDFPKP